MQRELRWPINLKLFILWDFIEKVCQLMIRGRNTFPIHSFIYYFIQWIIIESPLCFRNPARGPYGVYSIVWEKKERERDIKYALKKIYEHSNKSCMKVLSIMQTNDSKVRYFEFFTLQANNLALTRMETYFLVSFLSWVSYQFKYLTQKFTFCKPCFSSHYSFFQGFQRF